MTTVPANINPAARGPAHAPAPAVQGIGVDPVKLILRSKWLLLGAAGVGCVLGAAAHVAWMKFYPFYKPRAIFECFPPESDAWTLPGAGAATSNDELTTFMQTQVRMMTSEDLMQSIAESPKIKDIAKSWCDRFKQSDGQYNNSKIAIELESDIKARVITQTRLIELSFTWKNPQEAADVVSLVTNEYIARVKRLADDQFKDRTNTLNKTIDDAKREVELLKSQLASLISTRKVDSVDQRLTETGIRLELLNQNIIKLTGDRTEAETRLKIRQEQKNDKSGNAKIPEEIKLRVGRDPYIIGLQQEISTIQTALEGMRREGIQPAHRQFKQLESRLEASKAEFQVKQEEFWTREFESEINESSNMLQSFDNQLALARNEATELRLRQTELTSVITNIEELRERIRNQTESVRVFTDKLREMNVVFAQPTAARIMSRQQTIRAPKEAVFPKLLFMIPAGAALCLGLVGGAVVLREVVDQRIKGPGDVNLIPRARLLGWVADAGEDPAGPGVVETAFRDRPRGVLAENFRQIRSSLLKKMEVVGHKTVVVAGCMPSSGATSIASNLALAAAAAGKNVLLIDANFRRPALHRVFGVAEGPGLGEVLAGESPLDSAVQTLKDNPNLKVLSAGASAKRIYEALASDALGAVLAEARGKFDCVFIDVSPAVVSGDAVTLANRADASILVARTFAEKRGLVARVKNELSEVRGEFLGIVVNGVKAAAGGYLKGNIKASAEYQTEADVKA